MIRGPVVAHDTRRKLAGRLETLTIIHAHPDDEILFFLGWIRALCPSRLRLICVTDDFGPQTKVRRAEFAAVAVALGGEGSTLGLEDRRAALGDSWGASLDQGALAAALSTIEHRPGDPVLTHGPMGEYGHCHHVDVFRAVCHRFGDDVWCVADVLEVHASHDLGTPGSHDKHGMLSTLYPSQGTVESWGCGYEALCHVASSRFAGLFGVSRSSGTPPRDMPHALMHNLAVEFLNLLAHHYIGPERDLPRVAKQIEAQWASPLFDQWMAARFHEWRRRLMNMP